MQFNIVFIIRLMLKIMYRKADIVLLRYFNVKYEYTQKKPQQNAVTISYYFSVKTILIYSSSHHKYTLTLMNLL